MSQSLDKFLAEIGITLDSAVCQGLQTDSDGWKHYAWTITISGNGATYAVPFRMGTAHATKRPDGTLVPKAPTLADVIYSMHCDYGACEDTFADWCDGLGYSKDSLKTLHTYLACQESGMRLRRLTGPHLDRIRELAAEY